MISSSWQTIRYYCMGF